MKVANIKALVIIVLIALSQLTEAKVKSSRKNIVWDYIKSATESSIEKVKEWTSDKLKEYLFPNSFIKEFKIVMSDKSSANKEKIVTELEKLSKNLCEKGGKLDYFKGLFNVFKEKIDELPDENTSLDSIKKLIAGGMSDKSSEEIDKFLDNLKDCENVKALTQKEDNVRLNQKFFKFIGYAVSRILSLFGAESRKFVVMIGMIVIFALVYNLIGVVMSIIQIISTFGITIYFLVKVRAQMPNKTKRLKSSN